MYETGAVGVYMRFQLIIIRMCLIDSNDPVNDSKGTGQRYRSTYMSD